MKLSQINGWKENAPKEKDYDNHGIHANFSLNGSPIHTGCVKAECKFHNACLDSISSLSISVDKEYLEKYFLRKGLSEMMVSLFTVEIAANAEKFLRITKE